MRSRSPPGRRSGTSRTPPNPDGYLLPWHIDTTTTSGQAQPSTSHAWNVQHESWDGGLMDGFVSSHIAANGATTARTR